ncbi:MAG: methyl-accepting chemotaxis protein [Pseudomonadota bacterium]
MRIKREFGHYKRASCVIALVTVLGFLHACVLYVFLTADFASKLTVYYQLSASTALVIVGAVGAYFITCYIMQPFEKINKTLKDLSQNKIKSDFDTNAAYDQILQDMAASIKILHNKLERLNELETAQKTFNVEKQKFRQELELLQDYKRVTSQAECLMTEVSKGDCSLRIVTEDLQGPVLYFAQNTNGMMSTLEKNLSFIKETLSCISKGELTLAESQNTIEENCVTDIEDDENEEQNLDQDDCEISTKEEHLVQEQQLEEDNQEIHGLFAEISGAFAEISIKLSNLIQETTETARAASLGNFARRIDISSYEGAFLNLAESINKINEISDQGLTEIEKCVSAISHGDLSQTIEGDLDGQFEDIKLNFNKTLQQLSSVITSATEQANAASAGDFSHRIEVSDKAGFLLELSQSMNNINEISERGLGEIRDAVKGISEGDLTNAVNGEYQGLFDEIKQAINESQEKLNSFISDMTEVSFAAARGDFTQEMNSFDKEGFMIELSEGINVINAICLKGLTEVKGVIEALSKGDLTTKVEGKYTGMFDDIKQALNSTIDAMSDVIDQIHYTSDSVSTASSEITVGSNDLARRTETQASSLHEIVASIEQMSTGIQNNAESASVANELATQAQSAAEESGQVVGCAIEAMDRIEKSSRKVADITNVIDEIAFQINLLALNAAVEAARAGDAGKGFEVVAAEVRKLAQRSADAAKDIDQLIESGNQEVQQGTKLVKDTGGSLEQILGGVAKLADIVDQISNASVEQSIGIDEINKAIALMDNTTQQNAAVAEENMAACSALAERAVVMQEKVQFFQIQPAEDEEDAEISEEKIAS